MQVFFDGAPELARTVVAAVFAYGCMITVLRIAGKHALTKLHVFDYVVTVALGSTLASILLNDDVALAEGLVAVVMLVGMQWVVAKISVSSEPLRRIIRSDPRVLMRHGQIDADALKGQRMTEVEVDIAIRSAGFGDRSAIACVVLEADGSLSVISEDLFGDGSALDSLPKSERGEWIARGTGDGRDVATDEQRQADPARRRA